MPDIHCKLSASSSHRFLNCEKSVSLTDELPDVQTIYSSTGTLAHTACQITLEKEVHPNKPVEEMPKEVTKDMLENAELYTSFVMEFVNEYKNAGYEPEVMVEQQVSYSDYIPDSFGTSDTIIAAGAIKEGQEGIIHIIDYKNGSLKVDVEANSQLMIYGLGALQMFGCLYDFKTVRLSIFQPNISNYGTWEISVEDLIHWGLTVLKPAGERILNNHDLSWKSGDWCTFCKIKASCRQRAKDNLCLAEKDFALPDTLTNDEIASILHQIDDLVSWSNDIKEYALNQSLKGEKFEGWKLVAGRSNRKISDEQAVVDIFTKEGIDPYEKKLLSLTELQKKMGKSKFVELIDKYLVKPEGKPTLVVESDKRPELVVSTAQDEFKNNDNMEEN